MSSEDIASETLNLNPILALPNEIINTENPYKGSPRVYSNVIEIKSHPHAIACSAFDAHLNTPVFIKVSEYPPSSYEITPEAVQIAKLEHPNIARVLDRFNTKVDGKPVLVSVSKFIEGSDMREMIEAINDLNNDVPLDLRLKILKQVASAVDHANEHGVLHRDIKPSNIMVNGETAYLTDFGFANTVRRTDDGMIAGTPGYVSWEQLTGRDKPGDSEEWAVANVAYELLTGKRLIAEVDPSINEEQSIESKEVKIYEANIALDGLPFRAHETLRKLYGDKAEAVGEVFDKALLKKKEKRYSNASEFVEALQNELSN